MGRDRKITRLTKEQRREALKEEAMTHGDIPMLRLHSGQMTLTMIPIRRTIWEYDPEIAESATL
jgi:hypothetical protein